MEINARNFFTSWKEVVNDQRECLQKIWRENFNFTHQIIGNENSVLNNVAQKLSLMCYEKDYYCLDAIFYRKENLVPNIRNDWFWFRDIVIAFEHENHFNSGLFKEVSHLLITSCHLRVLVTYPNGDAIENKELEYLHLIIKGSNKSSEISQNENFLLIFGYENRFEWIGYIFKEEGWIKIE